MNCRLPQTPRTPTAAAAHYFDDVFSRPAKVGDEQPRIRRSSTSRSIGNRGTFADSAHGDERSRPYQDLSDHERRKSEANEHIAKYVTEAFERIRANDGIGQYDDELETSLDDISDK